ncbi:MAG: sugar phosphate isomerase/epimerase [Methanomicrobiales archaeon]|nr:sugar phosphate isomerase/epimerase [Methanomicrobiales archaeon]
MLGISTYCLHQRPLADVLEALAPLTDCVEIMDDGPHFLETAAPLASFPFRYCFHAPARGVNIASLHEPIRKASVEVLVQCFGVAAEVDGRVVIHPGYFTWPGEREPAEERFRRSLAELRRAADQRGVRFSIENMGNWDYFFLRFPEEVPMLDGIDLALDVGHANLNGCVDRFLSCRIAHVHLHDNDGTRDSHAAVGTGTIDFRAVMAAVRRDHAIPIIEVETLEGVIRSLESLKGS